MSNRIVTAALVSCLVVGIQFGDARGDDVAALLVANDVAKVEAILGDVQHRFERGEATEIELRNGFRPIYELNEAAGKNLHAWAASSATSYVAHLAEGIYWKRRGLAARGDKYISETSEDALRTMKTHFATAKLELTKSRTLTAKAYLSLFHLLDIALHEGHRDEASALLRQGTDMLPSAMLMRGRYEVSLMPRWGGSYAKPRRSSRPRSSRARHRRV